MKIVTDTGGETEVAILSISVGAERGTPEGIKYSTIPVTMVLWGETPDFGRFLALIHKKIPMTSFPFIQFTSLDEDPTARITLLFHFLQEETRD